MASFLDTHSVGSRRNFDAAQLEEIDEMRVSSRFPVGAVLWIVSGLLVAGFMAAVIWNAYVKSPHHDFRNMGYAYFLAIAALAGTVYYLPTFLAFLFAPSPFVISREGFQYGRRQIDFAQIRGLQDDVGRPSTCVLLKDGASIKLRWPIWDDSAFWVSLLRHRSYPHLLSAAISEVRAGKRVWFGSKLALDQQSIHINGRVLPLGAVTDFHFANQSDRGDDSRKLKVKTLKKEYVLDERKIINPDVFTGLFKEIVRPQ
ncbi:hypothetical protein [Rhizobium sp. LEGMi135b]